MKRIIVVVLLFIVFLLPVSGNCSVELFYFESSEYEVLLGRSITIQPIVENISGKLTYNWSSSDESIVKVENGKIVGVGVGFADVTCVATSSQNQYTTKTRIEVLRPVSSFKVYEERVTIPYYSNFWEPEVILESDLENYKDPKKRNYIPLVLVGTEEDKNCDITWKSSNSDVLFTFSDGDYLAVLGPGTATLTGRVNDGSGRTVKFIVTVPDIFVHDEEITIFEDQVSCLEYQYNRNNGIEKYTIGVSGDCFSYEKIAPEDIFHGFTTLKIKPEHSGKGAVVFRENGKTLATIVINVLERPKKNDEEKESNTYETTRSYSVTELKTVIEQICESNFDYYYVSGDETGFTINVSMNGLAAAAYSAKTSGNKELLEGWDSVRDTSLILYSSIRDMLIRLGMENPSLMINVTNDNNVDNALLIVANGIVIYDCMN